jgi:F-type H+-transporting ATPase subunit a
MSLGLTRELISIQPQFVFSIGSFNIANSTLLIILIAIFFFVLGVFFVRKFKLIPETFQSVFELLYESILALVIQITGSRESAEKIFPVVATILVYFGFANIIAILPGLTDITYNEVAIFRTPTSDYNTTFGVSLAAVIILNIVSLKDYGLLGYLGKFFNFKGIITGFKKGVMEGFVGVVEFFVGMLDVIGEIAKIVSLSFRLFGNIYAGQVLAIIIMGAFAYGLPVLWSAMSILSGLIQGVVFAALVSVYYSLGLKPVQDK